VVRTTVNMSVTYIVWHPPFFGHCLGCTWVFRQSGRGEEALVCTVQAAPFQPGRLGLGQLTDAEPAGFRVWSASF
jgi:hypothetical protein